MKTSIGDSIIVRATRRARQVHVGRWAIAALCSTALMVATASADSVWTSAADLNRCTALAGPPHSEERGAYCSGLFPASRRGRCTEEVGASAANWNAWCAAEWTIRPLPEAGGSSLLPADPSIQKCEQPSSPIVIDLRGDGFALTDAANGVPFDLRGAGRPEVWSWTALESDDAWLALDRNQNGLIDDGSELFGNYTMQPPSSQPNGFTALAVFDEPAAGGNRDSRIDAGDGVFARLRLWQDRNHDGISQPTELISLPQAGIKALSLSYSVSDLVDRHGNAFRYVADVEAEGDAPVGRQAYDVFLLRVRDTATPIGGPVATSLTPPYYVCVKHCFSISTMDGSQCTPYEQEGFDADTSLIRARIDSRAECWHAATLAHDRYGVQRCTDLLYQGSDGALYQVGEWGCAHITPAPPPPGGCI